MVELTHKLKVQEETICLKDVELKRLKKEVRLKDAELKRLKKEVRLKDENIKRLKKIITFRDEDITNFQSEIRGLKAELFGPKSEKSKRILDDTQGNLFDFPSQNDGSFRDSKDNENPKDSKDDERSEKREKTKKRNIRSKKLPDNLTRKVTHHDLPEEDKKCGCGGIKQKIGEDRTEHLEYIPAEVRVRVDVYPKYVCKKCDGVEDYKSEKTIARMPGPSRMIPGSIAGENLLAHLMTAKYADGLPFYRVSNQMERLGLKLSRANMSNWSIYVGKKLKPLWEKLLDQVKAHTWLQMDETRIQVLNEKDRKNKNLSYMWVIRGGPPDQPVILFKYAPSRSAQIAQELLVDYKGIVQTDGYSGYYFLNKDKDIIHAEDWNHTRRKFVNIVKATPGGKVKANSRVGKILKIIRQLYRIETQIRQDELEPEAVRIRRQEQASPIINELHDLLVSIRDQTPPKGLLGLAINYALNRWTGLKVYLDHGDLPIDTNGVESAIRPFAVGRKAWLFSGHPNGATASANIYSIVETAKANGWKTDAYLLHLFTNLPNAKSEEELKALLPTVPPPKVLKVETESTST